MQRTSFTISIICLAILFSAIGILADKPNLAILDFTESGSQIPGSDNLARAKMEEIIIKIGRHNLIERSRILNIINEQQFQVSGMVDQNTAIEIAKIAGAQFVIFGDVTETSINKERKERQLADKNGTPLDSYRVWDQVETKASISIKIVNVETAQIIYAGQKSSHISKNYNERTLSGKQLAAEKGQVSDEAAFFNLLSTVITGEQAATGGNQDKTDPLQNYAAQITSTIQAACKEFGKDLVNAFPLRGYIIQVQKKYITIDLGSNDGIKKGYKLYVIRPGEPITHPQTGEIIPGADIELGIAKVKSVSPQSSLCKVKGKVAKQINTTTDQVKSKKINAAWKVYR